MNQKRRVVRTRLPDQSMSDPVPEVDAEGLGQRVDQIPAPRFVKDPLQRCEQMSERANAAGIGTDRLPSNY